MTPDETKKVAELRQWADRCERQGRTSQAILVRNMAYEIEHGAPWLAFMAEEQRKREIAQTHEAMLDRASQNFDFGGGE